MDQNEDSTQNGKLGVRNYRIPRNVLFVNRKSMQGFFRGGGGRGCNFLGESKFHWASTFRESLDLMASAVKI